MNIVQREEYRGYHIEVEERANSHFTASFCAHTPSVADTDGDSIENALQHHRNKIDLSIGLIKNFFQPLTPEEQDNLRDYVKKNADQIARTLRRKHYIKPSLEFSRLTPMAIYHHYDIIEEALHSEGEEIEIYYMATNPENEDNPGHIILVDVEYYQDRRDRIDELNRELRR